MIRSVLQGAGWGGGGDLRLTPPVVPQDASGDVSRLRSNLRGDLTFSKLSGAAAIGVSAAGIVSLSAALGEGGSAVFRARVQNTIGDAIERELTLRGAAPAPAPSPSSMFDFTDPQNAIWAGISLEFYQ